MNGVSHDFVGFGFGRRVVDMPNDMSSALVRIRDTYNEDAG